MSKLSSPHGVLRRGGFVASNGRSMSRLFFSVLLLFVPICRAEKGTENSNPSAQLFEDLSVLTATDIRQKDWSIHWKWHCVEKQSLKTSCSLNYPLSEQGSSFGLSISESDGGRHFYSLAHAISGEVCQDLQKRIRT